ncbi:hypothetical protein QBC46DRAFT_413688 [Diplogelasinospora grovesii]|uniref:Uncharacterized protein n=1 Tax=Diplogelasinospora grovesii TaxID=303347 RepID=A0AAN6RZ99_9PEZI|nr:hypothetical protein QBC46DRAFT_413688 [Diplogelasinospora grovesii]
MVNKVLVKKFKKWRKKQNNLYFKKAWGVLGPSCGWLFGLFLGGPEATVGQKWGKDVIAVVNSVWNNDVRTHLAQDVGLSSDAIELLLHDIATLARYPIGTQTAIRVACANAYNTQMRYTIIFTGISFFVAASLWRREPLRLGQKGELEDFNDGKTMPRRCPPARARRSYRNALGRPVGKFEGPRGEYEEERELGKKRGL